MQLYGRHLVKRSRTRMAVYQYAIAPSLRITSTVCVRLGAQFLLFVIFAFLRVSYPGLIPCCVSFIVRNNSTQIFRAQNGVLTRSLWWDHDTETRLTSTSVSSRNIGADESIGTINTSHLAARPWLRRMVRESMALGDFFAKNNARGQVWAVQLNFAV